MRKHNKAQNDGVNQNVVLGKVSFEVSEAFNLLRAKLSFSLPGDGKCKVIGIVGAVRGIGKSFVAVNLADAIASDNKRVLLIDGDLRLPTIAQKTGLAAVPGLSNYLAGVGASSYEDIIQRFSDKFDVITSGNVPPNPSELLGSDKMGKLIEMLSQKYDYIIFDLPPTVVVSDALVVSKFVHGFLLVIRPNMDAKKSVYEMMGQFEFVQAKILGFVFNGSESKSRGYGKYRSGRTYKYRYYRGER